MKAITTTYNGPTETKPSRVSAKAESCRPLAWTIDELDKARETHGWPKLNAHETAARLYALRHGWGSALASGGTGKADIWVHCFIPKQLLSAARGVCDHWESGNLAAAVRDLSQAFDSYHEPA